MRVFVPERVDGVCIQFHMGAWIIGSARAGDDRSAEIAERCSVAVVSVEYRMVPEALPPAQLEDALNVIDWVRTEGRARFGDVPLVLIGESAGCTLAVLSPARAARSRRARRPTSSAPPWRTGSTTCRAARASASTPARSAVFSDAQRWCTRA